MSGLASEDLLETVKAIDVGTLSPDFLNKCVSAVDNNTKAKEIYLHNFTKAAAQIGKFIPVCAFVDEYCDMEHDFELTTQSYGICYTFNGYSRVPPLKTNGTGSHYGLQLVVNISQFEYIGSELLDAGVKIFVHPSSEPARVLDQGIAVPPGAVLYAGMERRDVINKAGVDCAANRDNSNFNFLGNRYNYSEHGCLQDCLLTEIAEKCRCYYVGSDIPPSNPSYANWRNCTFADICCIERIVAISLTCDCPTACVSTQYDLTTSYSSFPSLFNLYSNVSSPDHLNELRQNFLEVSVYFQTLDVRKEATTFSYSFIALLSDIGGLLSLYLTISIFSFVELFTWLLDELKDRLCCLEVSFHKKNEQDVSIQLEGLNEE